jgi:hypothetical protein
VHLVAEAENKPSSLTGPERLELSTPGFGDGSEGVCEVVNPDG